MPRAMLLTRWTAQSCDCAAPWRPPCSAAAARHRPEASSQPGQARMGDSRAARPTWQVGYGAKSWLAERTHRSPWCRSPVRCAAVAFSLWPLARTRLAQVANDRRGAPVVPRTLQVPATCANPPTLAVTHPLRTTHGTAWPRPRYRSFGRGRAVARSANLRCGGRTLKRNARPARGRRVVWCSRSATPVNSTEFGQRRTTDTHTPHPRSAHFAKPVRLWPRRAPPRLF